MEKLIEEIIKPILEANSNIKKVVGIYGGRFQPFGPHHYKTYKWLTKQVDDAYITTSNIKKPPRHPMNFREKVRHMSKMGVKSNRIIEEKSPYVAKNLAKKYNKDTTAFVYVFGAKDAGRLGGKYFQDYKRSKGNINGFEENGYYLVAPHVSISVGGKEVSGTSMRELLGSSKIDDSDRAKLFKKMFGYYDKGLFQMMTNKFKKLYEKNDPSTGGDNKKFDFEPIGKNMPNGEDDLLLDVDWFKKGSKKDRALKLKISKLYSKAFKMMPGSPNQKKIQKEIEKLRNQLGEDVNIVKKKGKDGGDYRDYDSEPDSDWEEPYKIKENVKLNIKVGDTILMGRFKNKKVKIKSIDVNDKGDLIINGRPALKFRMPSGDKVLLPKPPDIKKNPFDDIDENKIEEFLTTVDFKKIIDEGTTATSSPADDGPTFGFGTFRHYLKNQKKEAQKLGFKIVNYILQSSNDLEDSHPEYPQGPIKSVTYAPAGAGTGKTSNNQEDLTGSVMWNKYMKHISRVALTSGMKMIKYLEKEAEIAKKDALKTKKQSKLEEPTETKPRKIKESFTKNWWKNIIKEDWWTDMSVEAQNAYLKKHNTGKKVIKNNPSGKDPKSDTGDWENIKPKKDDSWMKGKDGWEILDDENVEVAKTKKYSKEQARDEVGEYFENKKTLKAVPNLVKDEDELTQKILDAKEETFSSEEIQNIRNTDAGEILDASEDGGIEGMKALGKQKAKEYKKGWDYITKNIESGEPQEAPIAIRDKNNELYLMAGNTRLMSNTAYGRKIPLKVIEYDGEFKDNKQEESFTKNWWKKELLNEGGAYGHMAHPFDDKDLTFGDLKKIIELGLGGNLSREDNVTEKLDGQNIMISWKDGKLIAARNKGHIKNGGKTALTAKGIASKFKGRGEIANAFNFAMKDLERAIKGLSQKQKDKIFNNGYNFMNMEVMWPKSANVIDYDVATLVFHGALKYDDSAKVIGEVPGSGRILQGMIQQINQHIGKKYSIGKPNFLSVPKHQDFGKMKKKFLGKLSKLQSQFGLGNSDTLALYHQQWWEAFILKQLKKVSPKVLKGLTKRWAFFDKSYKIPQIKKDLKDEPIFLEWVLSFDKQNHAAQVKKNMKPFEELFFEVGAEILKNVKGFIAANPDKAVQGINKRLNKAISNVRSGGDLKKLNTLKLQLDKLNAIGGINSIVPSEGIVFKYKGNTYKFTGAFAPVNQITGLVSF